METVDTSVTQCSAVPPQAGFVRFIPSNRGVRADWIRHNEIIHQSVNRIPSLSEAFLPVCPRMQRFLIAWESLQFPRLFSEPPKIRVTQSRTFLQSLALRLGSTLIIGKDTHISSCRLAHF